MNQKSTESAQTSDLIHHLTCYWIAVEQQAGDMTYTEYIDLVTRLQAVTGDLERTKFIVACVFQQADALGRSSAWRQAELRFESIAAGVGDRAQLLRLAVAHQKASDDSLDLYNERLNRFC